MQNKASKKGPSQRQLRVGELLRKALGEIFIRADLQAPDLDGVILSVSEVAVSPDIRNGTAFVAPLGGHENGALVVAALNAKRKYLRGLVSRQVDLKYMPDLNFKLDETLGTAERIDEILRSDKVAQDLD